MTLPQVNVSVVDGTAHAIVRGENLCGADWNRETASYATTRRNYLGAFGEMLFPSLAGGRDEYPVCRECQVALLAVPTEDVDFYRDYPATEEGSNDARSRSQAR
jgi:hypothetical protein